MGNPRLDDRTDHPEWKKYAPAKLTGYKFDFTGESALNWAIDGTSDKEPTTNLEKWSVARSRFYNAITYTTKSDRDRNMAIALLSLGSVAHLLEDMGVPAHVRNDSLFGHYRTWYDHENDLEKYAEGRVISNGGQSPWLGSSPVVFDKLAKYFDADMYLGSYLGDGILPPNTWGLSECSNYQFISTSTFPGCTGTLYQFPNPSTTHFGMDLTVPVTEGKKIYFNGSNYGVSHIARKSYTQYYADEHGLNEGPIDNTNTTDDEQVFVDYTDITVPRTINYATGLINYFFRGRLEIEPNCLDCNTVTFFIRNDSNNSGVAQTLKGGAFELYWDDRDGNRTKVNDFSISGWTENSTLNYNQQVTGTFNKPDSSGIERYTIVYRGAISANPEQPDNDDADAIAVGTLIAGYQIIAWGRDNEGEVSNVPEGNDFVDVAAGKYHALAIRSSGALAAWGWNSYGQCNVPEGNDFIAISGGSRHSIALKSDGTIVGWGDNSVGQTNVPLENGFVAIASGDYHNLAITSDGHIIGWGRNDFGECDAPEPNVGTVFVAVSAGKYHSLALQSDGRVRAWGNSNNGQTRVYLGAGNDHEAVAAGDDYNFLLLTDDMLVTWGGGDWLEPGMPDYHYRQPDEHDFVAIAAGGYHILALTRDGQILSWGYNDYDPPPYPVPEGIAFTKDVAAGWKFSVALKFR